MAWEGLEGGCTSLPERGEVCFTNGSVAETGAGAGVYGGMGGKQYSLVGTPPPK